MTKRTIIRSLTGCIIAVTVVIATCNIIVNCTASGKTYDDVDEIPRQEYGVLLGTNPLNRFGKRNRFYHHRIEAAKALYQHGKVKKIIISGADRGESYNEPAAMRDELIAAGIPDSVILLDGDGHTTLLSVKNTHAFTDSVTFISQKFHNQRSIYYAQHAGLDAIGYNAFSPMGGLAFRVYIREALARVKAVFNVILQK